MAAQASLCLAWSETPEDTFCRVVAHMYIQPPRERVKAGLSLAVILRKKADLSLFWAEGEV